MTSILKVDTIQDQSGNNIINENADTITIGASGDTITIPSGATIDLSNATQTGVGGVNTPAFEATLSSQSVTNATTNKLSLSTEVFDTDSCYDNVTNYRFTPTTAGKYFVYGQAFYEETGNVNRLYNSTLNIYFNGSAITNGTQTFTSNNATYSTTQSISFHATINMNGSTDYLELFSYVQVSSGTPVIKNGRFGAYKLIEYYYGKLIN
jgi:hypothetical protein